MTQAEAAQAVGRPVKRDTATTDQAHVCRYFSEGVPQARLTVDTAPLYCKLLYLALKKNIFGHGSGRGVQLRINDIGTGGMLVLGNGNVQITVAGGCFTIDADAGEVPVADGTMLRLARTAVTRVGESGHPSPSGYLSLAHVRQRVAHGSACNRSAPMKSPQRSQIS